MKQDDYMWLAGNSLANMRLAIDGAVSQYEEIAPVLIRSQLTNEMRISLDTIGTALYTLQEGIHALQKGHMETVRETAGG